MQFNGLLSDSPLVEFTRWIWHKTSVPVFLERFVLPLFAASVGLLAWSNPMGFDTTQRVTGAITLVFAAYFVGHTVYKGIPKNPPIPAPAVSTPPPLTQQQERLVIISQLVEEYKKTHKGKMPTFRYLNNRLKEQGRDFQINPPPPPAGGMTFIGGKFEGNGVAISNSDPNAQLTFHGTDFINNKQGIVNVPAKQSDKSGKP